MKYDDASWHFEGDYPDDLPQENGATHIGMFLAWAVGRDLAGDELRDEVADELTALANRQLTPGAFVLRACDGKLTDEDLNEVGNAFAESYYEPGYLTDYAALFGGGAALYDVEDSWTTFDQVKPVLDRRFDVWRAGQGS
jgi:hypothetical protein